MNGKDKKWNYDVFTKSDRECDEFCEGPRGPRGHRGHRGHRGCQGHIGVTGSTGPGLTGTLIKVSTSGTVTIPAGSVATFEVYGGGGGGGSEDGNYVAGGGGAGGYVKAVYTFLTATTLTITIGAGGAGGTTGTNTTVTGGGILLTANGGGAGSVTAPLSSLPLGGPGGGASASGVGTNFAAFFGANGQNGYALPVPQGDEDVTIISGSGGPSFGFGGGYGAILAGGNACDGLSGQGPGAGGGGGARVGTYTGAAGNGDNGAVIITY